MWIATEQAGHMQVSLSHVDEDSESMLTLLQPQYQPRGTMKFKRMLNVEID
jgi:hypothetical protein